MIEVRLPQFGMGMQDAVILQWYYKLGDLVKEGEPLLQIEAAKATIEVPAPASGVLASIVVQENETAHVRDVIATLTEAI